MSNKSLPSHAKEIIRKNESLLNSIENDILKLRSNSYGKSSKYESLINELENRVLMIQEELNAFKEKLNECGVEKQECMSNLDAFRGKLQNCNKKKQELTLVSQELTSELQKRLVENQKCMEENNRKELKPNTKPKRFRWGLGKGVSKKRSKRSINRTQVRSRKHSKSRRQRRQRRSRRSRRSRRR